MTHSPSALEADVFQKLATSGVFSQFEDAFRSATGLPLRIIRWDEEFCLGEHRENQSPFCELLNKCKTACSECIETNRRLLEESERVDGPMTCGCFSGLCATAVPVKLGKTTIGFLKTGQVFRRQPTEEDFARVVKKLEIEPADQKALHDAYFQTKQIDPKRYDSMITLLEMFADQLSKHAETVSVVVDGSEPAGIARARKMIHRQLEDPISFSELAKVAGMSESHFCRTFKDVTTMTVTEYTTRARIAWRGRSCSVRWRACRRSPIRWDSSRSRSSTARSQRSSDVRRRVFGNESWRRRIWWRGRSRGMKRRIWMIRSRYVVSRPSASRRGPSQ